MRWFTYNWQLKLLALGLSIFLWLVLHFNVAPRPLAAPKIHSESK